MWAEHEDPTKWGATLPYHRSSSPFTLIKAPFPHVSATDCALGARTSSERESRKESCKSQDRIRVHCKKKERIKHSASLSEGLEEAAGQTLRIPQKERHDLGSHWRRAHLKSAWAQCCRQTSSWYSDSSKMMGLPVAEEPSCDWDEPRGLCRA